MQAQQASLVARRSRCADDRLREDPNGIARALRVLLVIAVAFVGFIATASAASAQGAPTNDDIADAQVITSTPATTTGSNVDATIAPDETLIPGECGNKAFSEIPATTVWYQGIPTSSQALTVDTLGSAFDTIVAVYTSTSANPTFSDLTLIACNDDIGNGNVQSSVTSGVDAGTTYYIQVSGYGGAAGSFNLNISRVPCSTTIAETMVTSAAELDSAIWCYNDQSPPGDHTINLIGDIDHAGGTPAIAPAGAVPGNLIINGNGNTLNGPSTIDAGGNVIGDSTAFVSLIQIDSTATTTINDLGVTEADGSGIGIDGGTVVVNNSTIHHNALHGIISNGSLSVSSSAIHDNEDVGLFSVGSLSVSNSTIHDNGDIGIIAAGSTWVGNSTIHDNTDVGILVTNDIGVGVVDVVSSLIAAADGVSACGGDGTFNDLGNNFASDTSCDAGLELLTAGSFDAAGLADNGGLTDTIALLPASNAIGGGTCTNVIINLDVAGSPVTGDLVSDQRGDGFPRLLGANCDAGAFELDVCAAATNDVDSQRELDDAIVCYNAQSVPGDYVINLIGDIDHASGAPTIAPVGAVPGNLIINGNGNTLAGPSTIDAGGNVIDGLPLTSVNLIDIDSTATTTINDLIITQSDSSGIGADAGAVVVNNSTVHHNLLSGISSTGSLSVSNSTIHNNTGSGISVAVSALASVSNSTIHNNGSGGINVVANASAWVSNSTIHNNTGAGILTAASGGSPDISLVSSLIVAADGVPTCGGDGTFNDLGNNFASDTSCGADVAVLPTGSLAAGLADNGGPTETVALLPASNAIGGGDCTDVVVGLDAAGSPVIDDLTTDQRGTGFVRKLGANCDAGAFEVTLTTVFSDISNTAFYSDAVTWAVSNGITNGTGDGTTFSPAAPVTRGQMATFLWRLAGEPVPTDTNSFTDVPAGQFYTTPVIWLAETGITTGTGDGTTFSPNQAVTRAQLATFLWRFDGEPVPGGTNSFTDVPAGQFYTIPVTWLAETGITTGTGDGTTFSPNQAVTRAQMVTFLLRFAQQPPG